MQWTRLMIGEVNHLHINHVIRDCSSFQKGKKKKKSIKAFNKSYWYFTYQNYFPRDPWPNPWMYDCLERKVYLWDLCLKSWIHVSQGNHSNNLLLLQCLHLLMLFSPLQDSNCIFKCSFPTIVLKYSLSVLHKMILKKNEDFAWAKSKEG